MTYHFTWEPTPPVRTGAEMRRVAIFAAGIGSVFICSTLAQFGVSFIFSLFAPELLKQMWFRLLASTFCLYLFGMLPGWLILRNIKPEPIESRRLGAVSVVALLSVSVAFLLLGSFAGNFVNTVIESLTGKAQRNPVQNVADNTPLGVMALCTVILLSSTGCGNTVTFRQSCCRQRFSGWRTATSASSFMRSCSGLPSVRCTA